MNEAIKLAIEKGGYLNDLPWEAQKAPEQNIQIENGIMQFGTLSGNHYGMPSAEVFLDPLFWKCLGKALGQGDFKNDETGQGSWKFNWHRFIDHIAEGKDPELYWKEIIK